MPTTIDLQNAKQIREKPMDVYVSLQTGSSASISSVSVAGNYILYDTITNINWRMRQIADLAGDGFPLDGTREFYHPEYASEYWGKTGLRGDIGEDLSVTITGSGTLDAVTIASSGASSIRVGGETYAATGLDVVVINAASATIQFTAADPDERIVIEYIVPGAQINVTNEELTNVTLALRGNLDPTNNTWQESEIEVSFYYPHDISRALPYIQTDWPITYRAGYDSDLSDERKFYLSDAITQKDNIITIHGVDASHKLGDKTMSEQWLDTNSATGLMELLAKFIAAIKSTGITIERANSQGAPGTNANTHAVIPEMTVRDFIAGVMNLSISSANPIQFVDAGIPTVEIGPGTAYGRTWAINKSDTADWEEAYEQNIGKIVNTSEEQRFNETLTIQTGIAASRTLINVKAVLGQIYDVSYDGFYANVTISNILGNGSKASWISSKPTGGVLKCTKAVANSNIIVSGSPMIPSGGADNYANPNGLAGVTLEADPFIYGSIKQGAANLLDIQTLFDRSMRTGSFTWKGDPRMQPLDYLTLTDDTVTPNETFTARVTDMEMTHEGGGTQARITWREWS